MALTNNINGIIFDLDGTLYRMQWFMRPLLAFKLLPRITRLTRFLKVRGRFAGKPMGCRENLLNSIADAVSKQEKVQQVEIYNWILLSFYPAFLSLMPFFKNSRPGIQNMLSTLRISGFKLAVLSDYDHVAERLLNLEINPSLFDITISSEAAGALKPCAEPFLNIASSWNISPENILVVGDRNDTDGEAARAAGMQFLQISDSSKTIDASGWDEIKKILLSLKD